MVESSEAPIGSPLTAHPKDVHHFFQAVVRSLEPRVLSALPEGVRVAVQVQGDGGGAWTIERTERAVEVHQGVEAANDCLMVCGVQDFEALLRGEVNGVRHFMSGRLHVEGDVGLALALQQVIVPAASAR